LNRQDLQKKGSSYGASIDLGKRVFKPVGFVLENGEGLSKARRGMAIRKGSLSRAGSSGELIRSKEVTKLES
jgi:hypothetical protein